MEKELKKYEIPLIQVVYIYGNGAICQASGNSIEDLDYEDWSIN